MSIGAGVRRAFLERFLTDGRIKLDSNIVEAPSDHRQLQERLRAATGADEPRAIIATLLQAAKMNNVDPFAWLRLLLRNAVIQVDPAHTFQRARALMRQNSHLLDHQNTRKTEILQRVCS
ncbi:hypothetical protein ABIF86_000411 [Bradyrhizobium japonicum]